MSWPGVRLLAETPSAGVLARRAALPGPMQGKKNPQRVYMPYAAEHGPELGRLWQTWAAHPADRVAAASVCASASRHMLSVTSENVSPAESCLSAGALATPLAESIPMYRPQSMAIPLNMAVSCHHAKEALHHILPWACWQAHLLSKRGCQRQKR